MPTTPTPAPGSGSIAPPVGQSSGDTVFAVISNGLELIASTAKTTAVSVVDSVKTIIAANNALAKSNAALSEGMDNGGSGDLGGSSTGGANPNGPQHSGGMSASDSIKGRIFSYDLGGGNRGPNASLIAEILAQLKGRT